jgi:hypothetical protein
MTRMGRRLTRDRRSRRRKRKNARPGNLFAGCFLSNVTRVEEPAMPKRNSDQSRSKIVKMPQLHADTHAADVWFEVGMIHFEDPTDPNEVSACTLAHFKDYIETLREYVEDEEMIRHFVCGRPAIRRFIHDASDLIREVEPQLHVGLPIDTISDIEARRVGIAIRPGMESPGFNQRASGLIVPN